MKKILFIIPILAILFTACNKNELPKFDDSNAFVKLNISSASFDEDKGTVTIPVTVVSVSGVNATVKYTVTDGKAKLDENYRLVDPTATLTFDATNRVRNIEIELINKPGVYTGDLDFTITLSEESSIQIGAQNSCKVTISDKDHPLTPILGDYTAVGESFFNGNTQWAVTLKKDASDVKKVWIQNLVPNGTNLDVYGIVNDDMSEIRIPVMQEIYKSSTYPLVRLEGYYGPTGDDFIPQGGYITVEIAADKSSMTIKDDFGSHVYNDAAGTSAAGWYNYMLTGVVLTKN